MSPVFYWQAEAGGHGSTCGKIRRKGKETSGIDLDLEASQQKGKTGGAFCKKGRGERDESISQGCVESSQSSALRVATVHHKFGARPRIFDYPRVLTYTTHYGHSHTRQYQKTIR